MDLQATAQLLATLGSSSAQSLSQVPCIEVSHVTDDGMRAYRLADNKKGHKSVTIKRC